MRKRLYIKCLVLSLILASASFAACAGERFGLSPGMVRYGIEWGVSWIYWDWTRSNFNVPDGPRVDSMNKGFCSVLHGEASIFAGVNLFPRFSADIYLGARSLGYDRMMKSLSVRNTFYPYGSCSDGYKMFAEVGMGAADTFRDKPVSFGKLGAGYRWKLSTSFSLDASAAFLLTYDHPTYVYDSYAHNVVNINNVKRSDSIFSALALTLSINFR